MDNDNLDLDLDLLHNRLEELRNRLNLRNQDETVINNNSTNTTTTTTTNNNNNTITTPSETKLTYYWQVRESDFGKSNENNNTNIYTCDNKFIKNVNSEFYENLHIEGSGLLSSNQYINCANDNCTCFKMAKYPLGNHQNRLNFLTSVASRSLDFGQKLIINEFVNFKLANGDIHNGCFIVDDTGYSLGQNHLDLYVVNKEAYSWLDDKLNLNNVHISLNSNCDIKTYVVSESQQAFQPKNSLLLSILIIWLLKFLF